MGESTDDTASATQRRRLVQQAIRDGGDPPPGMERIALQVALRQAALRWIAALYVVGVVVEVASFVTARTAGGRTFAALLAVAFCLLARSQYRNGKLAKAAVRRWDVPEPRVGSPVEPAATPPATDLPPEPADEAADKPPGSSAPANRGPAPRRKPNRRGPSR